MHELATPVRHGSGVSDAETGNAALHVLGALVLESTEQRWGTDFQRIRAAMSYDGASGIGAIACSEARSRSDPRASSSASRGLRIAA